MFLVIQVLLGISLVKFIAEHLLHK